MKNCLKSHRVRLPSWSSTLLAYAIVFLLVWIAAIDLLPCMSGYGVRHSAICTICKKTLRETLYPALAQLIAENEESNECKNVPHTQTNIQRKILDHFPELEGVGCPLSANSQNITSISSYIINPNILSKSLSEWSPMDVIACDSDARHVGHSRGPGVQFVVYLTRDGSTGWAYVSGGEESPTRLSQLIRDFSTGIPGADKEFVWGTFSAIPDLQLKDFIPFYIRIAFVLILGCALGIRTGTYTILFGTAFDQGLRRGSSE